MKLCLISEYFYPDDAGGTGTVLSHLIRHLQDQHPDLQIDVITSKNLYRGETMSLPAFENWQGINICRLHTPKSNRPSTVLRLLAGLIFTLAVFRRLLFRRRYDLLFMVTSPPMLPLAVKAVGRLRRIPYLYLIHDLYPNVATALGVLSEKSAVGGVFRRFQRGWLHGAHKVVVLGYCMRDYLVEHYALPRERIEVITNWSNREEILFSPKETRFRQQHDLRGPIVLYAGNFGQYQNFDNLLDAAKLLANKGAKTHASDKDQPSSSLNNSSSGQEQCLEEEITFVLVGEGSRKNHIARRIRQENIGNVRLLPFVPRADLSDLLASADISLVTLEPGVEGLGVPSKFYNIMASGRPTVAIVGAHSEVARVVEEADCGLRVEQGNPEQLARTLAALLAAPQAMERMGRNARLVFEEKYTLHHIGEKFYSLFQKTTETSGAPHPHSYRKRIPETVPESSPSP